MFSNTVQQTSRQYTSQRQQWLTTLFVQHKQTALCTNYS